MAEFVKLFELVDYVFVWIGLISILFELVDYVFDWIGLISILFELVEMHELVEKLEYFNWLMVKLFILLIFSV